MGNGAHAGRWGPERARGDGDRSARALGQQRANQAAAPPSAGLVNARAETARPGAPERCRARGHFRVERDEGHREVALCFTSMPFDAPWTAQARTSIVALARVRTQVACAHSNGGVPHFIYFEITMRRKLDLLTDAF